MVIPVPLMPTWLQNIVVVLPFRYTADFPFRVYSGHIPQNEAVLGIVIQLPVEWSIPKAITLLLMVTSGMFIFTGLFILAPLAGIVFLVPCLLVWGIGVRHYRSTGS